MPEYGDGIFGTEGEDEISEYPGNTWLVYPNKEGDPGWDALSFGPGVTLHDLISFLHSI